MKALVTRRVRALMDGEHGRIARDMSAIFLFILLAKIVAAGKEIVVAWRFGTGPIVDAYLFVFNIVSIPAVVWFSMLSVVFIPLATRLRASAPDEERRFTSELGALNLLIGVAAAVLL